MTRALMIAAPIGVGLATLSRRHDRFAAVLVAAGALWSLTVLARVPRRDPVQRRADRRVGRRGRGRLPAALVPVGPVDVVARSGWRWRRRSVLVGLLYLPTALVVQHYPEPAPWSTLRHRLPAQRLRARAHDAGGRRGPGPPVARGAVGAGLPRRGRHPGPAHVSGRAAAAPDARSGARHGHLPWRRARGLRRRSRLEPRVARASTRSDGSTCCRSGSSHSASPSGCCGAASTPRPRCSG